MRRSAQGADISTVDDREAEYFGLAEAWDQELYGSLRQSRKIAWIVAGVSLGIAALSLLAVASLAPMKEVQPYLITVDRTTGYGQAVRQLVYDEATPMTEDEAVVIGEVTRYIVARETIDPADVALRTEQVRMSTDAEEYRRYAAAYTAILEETSPSTRKTVSIKSVTPDLPTKTARVRYSTTTRTQNQTETQHWIATLSYDFMELNLPMSELYKNPLGFIIQSYRVDPESL